MQIALLLAALISIAGATAAEERFRKLSGAQIRAAFSGMELSDEVHWYERFEKSGILFSSSMGRKRTGKWWVEKDELCIDDGEDPVKCYEVRVSGNRVQLRGEYLFPLDAVLRSPTDRGR